MKDTQNNTMVDGSLAALRPVESPIKVNNVSVDQPQTSSHGKVSVISQLEANMAQVEDLTRRLGFMMREVSHIIQKRSQ